jgi:hypothetical protein
MVTRLIEVAIVAAVLAVVIVWFPDLKRYLEIRQM